MDDRIKRIFEQQEAIQRLIDPLRGKYRQHVEMINNITSSLSHNTNIFNDHNLIKLLPSITAIAASTHLNSELSEQLNKSSTFLNEIQRAGLVSQSSSTAKIAEQLMQAQKQFEGLFRVPSLPEINKISKSALTSVDLARLVFKNEDPLQKAMTSMVSPWLQMSESFTSAKAFSELCAIGHGINTLPAFDYNFTKSLRNSFGDWRDEYTPTTDLLTDHTQRTIIYEDQGFDSSLTEFTLTAFDEGLNAAGLSEPLTSEDYSDQEADLSRAEAAYSILMRFEHALRRYIEKAMMERFGSNWMKQQLPNNMLDSWTEKREKAIKSGQPEFPLIDYADFTDYKAIIDRRDNWKEVFQFHFGRQEDVRESLQRLFPVRIATMHSRIITLDDDLFLRAETRRILKAIFKS